MASDSEKLKRHTLFPGSGSLVQGLDAVLPSPKGFLNPHLSNLRKTNLGLGSRTDITASHSQAVPETRNPQAFLRKPKINRALVAVFSGSPWEKYEKKYSVDLGGSAAVARRKPATFELFDIRSFSGSDAEEKVYMLRQIKNENFLRFHEVYDTGGTFYTIAEHMEISLVEIIAAPTYPTEIQVAAITSQVLNGIIFLASEKMMHGNITCSHIVLSKDGDVKIANPEHCCQTSQSVNSKKSRDTLALRRIMITLMEKVAPDDDDFELGDTGLWSAKARDFLSQTITAISPQNLAAHAFLQGSPHKEELVELIAFAQTSASRIYDRETQA